MSEMIRQSKKKKFPHEPYDMYNHYSPVYGFFIDNDNKSETFGEVCFGQIGERNDFELVQSYKDDTDMTLIKEQLIKNFDNENGWAAEFVDYYNEFNENENYENSENENFATNKGDSLKDTDVGQHVDIQREEKGGEKE